MADAIQVTIGGTVMPGGLVSAERNDELLWSDGTGRAASDGLLVGSVVAKKQRWAFGWGIIPQSDYDRIRAIPVGFTSLKVAVDGTTVASVSAYRSTVTGRLLGVYDGTPYWMDVSVEMVER